MKWWLGRPDTGYYIDLAEHGYKAALFSAATVTRALVLLCFFPFVYSLAVFGPDSLLLCTVCAAFYYAHRGNWTLTTGGVE